MDIIPKYKTVTIQEFELKVSVAPDRFVAERLAEAGFSFNRTIDKSYDHLRQQYTYYQRVDKRDLIFKKFDWPWEPKWKKIKRLLVKKFD